LAKQKTREQSAPTHERPSPRKGASKSKSASKSASKGAGKSSERSSDKSEGKRRSARAKPGPRAAARSAPAPSRRDDARARMYHELVFESAECVFGRSGFDDATMQDVASEAGVSLKTLYATFPGKHELYDEIQQVRGSAFVERVLAASALGGDPLERLERWTRAYLDFLLEHRDWLRIHLRSRTSWGLRPVEGYAAEYWEQGREGIGALLTAGMRDGVFYDGDVATAAALVLAVMQVEVSQVVDQEDADPERVTGEIMVQLERLLCHATPERPL
jgi:AcrR family transcriptional regulator